MKVVLVTGIGGNVGQGVLRNISAGYPEIHLIGTDIDDFSAGTHLCKKSYKIKYAYEDGYIDQINEIVEKEKVDMIFPSTDYEIYYLSKFKDQLSTTVVCSDVNTCETYLDKYLTWVHHDKFGIPFAQACLPSEYNAQWSSVIVKPRKGRGSRNLFFNPENIAAFDDDEYMVQHLVKGKEITSAAYIDKSGRLYAHMTMERTLLNGYTNFCKVQNQYNDKIESIFQQMVANGDFRGSINLQSIVDEDGNIHPFEVNCRISGTNSIRGHFGFSDVLYAIKEYLYEEELTDDVVIEEGLATRIVMDVIYKGAKNIHAIEDPNSNHVIF